MPGPPAEPPPWPVDAVAPTAQFGLPGPPAGPPGGWYQYPGSPYGAPPQAPYGYGYGNAYGYGFAPAPQGTNGLAIASLVLGICGFFCVTSFAGLGLGIGALAQIRRTGQPGRGMAVAGLVLSGLWIVLFLVLLAVGHGGSGAGPGVQDSGGTSA